MRRLWGSAGVLLLVIGAAACDVTQPADAGNQVFSVGATASAGVNTFDIYEVWLDTDADGTPDQDTGDRECDPSGQAPVNILVPWYYSMSLSVIPDGKTQEETVASTVDDADPFTNLTQYSTGFFGNPPARAPAPPEYYINGRRAAQTSRDHLENCTSLAPPPPLDEPNILGEFPTFETVLGQGDTVVLRVRKQLVADAPPDFETVSPVFLSLFGFVDGSRVSLEGDPGTAGDGGGTTLSFTLR